MCAMYIAHISIYVIGDIYIKCAMTLKLIMHFTPATSNKKFNFGTEAV